MKQNAARMIAMILLISISISSLFSCQTGSVTDNGQDMDTTANIEETDMAETTAETTAEIPAETTAEIVEIPLLDAQINPVLQAAVEKDMVKIGTFKSLPSSEIEDSVISIGFEGLDRYRFDPEPCYEPAGQTGIKYARLTTGWILCEKEKGVYDFTWLDDIVDKLIAQGLEPWMSIGFGNPLYMPGLSNPTTAQGCVPLYYGPVCLKAWQSYVRALVEHYKGKVTYYEIWNEPDAKDFWRETDPNGVDYARLVSVTSKVIREADPDAIIGGCMAGTNRSFAEAFATNIKVGDIDFMSFHEYYFPAHEINQIDEWKLCFEIFRRAGHDIDFWMGEGGYPSWVPNNYWGHIQQSDERQQAVGQLRLIFDNLALGFKRISIYQIADMLDVKNDKGEVTYQYAAQGILNRNTYTPKKSYETLSRAANLFSGEITNIDTYISTTFSGSQVESIAIKHHGYARGDQAFYAYWIPTPLPNRWSNRNGFTLKVETVDYFEEMKDPVLLDMYTGDVYELYNIEIRPRGFTAKNLPIGEYPMVICDRSLIEDNIVKS